MRKVLFTMMFWMLVLCGCASETEANLIDDSEYVLQQDVVEELEIVEETRTIVEEPIVEVIEAVTEETEEEETIPEYVMEDYTGVVLTDAITKLAENAITNVVFLTEDGDQIDEEEEKYEVVVQSIEVGASITAENRVELVCKKRAYNVFNLLQINSEEIKKAYTLEYYYDDEFVETIEVGTQIRDSKQLDMGSHIIKFIDSSNEENYLEYEFEVENDLVAKIEIKETKDEIVLGNVETFDNYSELVVTVPDMIGVRTDFATKLLEEKNITNFEITINEDIIDGTEEFTIVEQNYEADQLVLSDEIISFACMTTNEYLMDLYKDLSFEEFEAKSNEDGYQVTYIQNDYFGDFNKEFTEKSYEEKQDWNLVSITDKTTENEKAIDVLVVYAAEVEMPELVNEKLDDAKKKLKEIGFSNIVIDNPTDYTNANMLIVTSQNIKAKKTVTADSEVVLKVKKRVVATPTPTPTPTPEPTKVVKPTYTFTDMSATKYVKSTVNVRDLPDKSGNKVGSLSQNDEVTVTGKCKETGWYRIRFGGSVAYVSDSFLQDKKVEVATVTTPKSETTANNKSSNSNSTVTNTAPATAVPAASGITYVLNTNTKKFHKPSCGSVKKMKEKNKWEVTYSRDEVIGMGYDPCGNCHP